MIIWWLKKDKKWRLGMANDNNFWNEVIIWSWWPHNRGRSYWFFKIFNLNHQNINFSNKNKNHFILFSIYSFSSLRSIGDVWNPTSRRLLARFLFSKNNVLMLSSLLFYTDSCFFIASCRLYVYMRSLKLICLLVLR